MLEPKISVIIPVYNTETYLEKCLESVMSQTYKNLEIILVDDGSTDGSGKLVDIYAKKDERIVAIHKENGGVSSARNVGLNVSTGEYVGFVDSDDWIEPDMYDKMMQALDADIDMIACGYFKDSNKSSEEVKNRKAVSCEWFSGEEMLRYIFYREDYRGVAAYSWNKIIRRSLVLEKGIFFHPTLKVGEDVLWLVETILNVQKVKYVDVPLYHYWQRTDSAFHSEDLTKKSDLIRAYQDVIEMMGRYKIADDIIVYTKRFMVYHAMNIAKLAFKQQNREILKEMQAVIKMYRKDYVRTNKEYPERVDELDKVCLYKV